MHTLSTRHCCLLLLLYPEKRYIVTGTAKDQSWPEFSAVTPDVKPRHN
jgi:hypothetical protein